MTIVVPEKDINPAGTDLPKGVYSIPSPEKPPEPPQQTQELSTEDPQSLLEQGWTEVPVSNVAPSNRQASPQVSRQEVFETYKQAGFNSPEQTAKLRQIAREEQLPYDVVERDPNYWLGLNDNKQATDFLLQLDREGGYKYPHTANWIAQSPIRASIAKSDERILAEIEATKQREKQNKESGFVGKTASALGAGVAGLASGAAQAPAFATSLSTNPFIRAVFPELLRDNVVATSARELSEELTPEEATRNIPMLLSEGKLKEAAESTYFQVVQNSPQLIGIMAASALGAPNAAILGTLGTISASEKFAEERREGSTIAKAQALGAAYGGAEVVGEYLSLRWIKGLGSAVAKQHGKTVAKEYTKLVLKNFIEEGSSESATAAIQIAADYAAGDKITMPEAAARIINDGIVGGISGGAATTVAIPSINAEIKRRNQQAQIDSFDNQAESLNERRELAKQSQTRKLDPDSFEEHHNTVSEQMGVNDKAYVSLDKLNTLFQDDPDGRDGFINEMGIEDQVSQAEETNEDIELSQGKLLAKYADSEVFDRIQPELAFEPKGITQATKAEIQKQFEKDIETARQEVEQLRQENVEPPQIEEIRNKLTAKRKDGGFDLKAEDADKYTAVVFALAKTYASELGLTPQEYLSGRNIRLEVGGKVVQGQGVTFEQRGLSQNEMPVEITDVDSVQVTSIRVRQDFVGDLKVNPVNLKRTTVERLSGFFGKEFASNVDGRTFKFDEAYIRNQVDRAITFSNELRSEGNRRTNINERITLLRQLPKVLQSAVRSSVENQGQANQIDHYKAAVRIGGNERIVDFKVDAEGNLVDLMKVGRKSEGRPGAPVTQQESANVGQPPSDQLSIQEFTNRVNSFTFFQEEQRGPKGAITFGDTEVVIRLFESADMTTLIHELGHFAVLEMQRIVRQGQASEALQNDLRVLQEFVGTEFLSEQERNDLSEKAQAGDKEAKARLDKDTEAQETLARSFEAFFLEGKAPSNKLVDAFSRIRDWMLNVYKGIKDLNVNLTPEVRGVFNRMLASEIEIEQAQEFYRSKKNLEEAIPVPPERSEKIKTKKRDATQAAKNAQIKRALKAYYDSIGGPDQLRRVAENEVSKEPNYKAIDSVIEAGGISEASILELSNSQDLNKIKKAHKDAVVKEGGASIESVAVANDLTPQQLVELMLNTESKSTAIDNKFNEIALERELEIKKIIEQSETVPGDTAHHNDSQLELLIEEEKALREEARKLARKNGAQTPEALDRKVFDRLAQERIDNMSVKRATRPDVFGKIEKSLADKYDAAIDRGDFIQAHDFRKQQIFHHMLVQKSIKARDIKNKIENRYTTTKVKSKTKNVENDYAQTARNWISFFGLNTAKSVEPRNPDSIPNVRDLDVGLDALTPNWIKNRELGRGKKDYRDLSMKNLIELDKAIGSVLKYGRQELQSLQDDQLKTVEEAAEASIENMSKLKDNQVADQFSIRGRLGKKVDGLLADINMTEFLFEQLDNFQFTKNGTFGVLRRFFNRGVKAATDFNGMKQEVFDAAKAHWEVLGNAKKRLEKKYGGKAFNVEGVPVTDDMRRVGRNNWTVENLIAFALNTGNVHNKTTLQNAFNYTPEQVNRMLAQFTEQELNAIQGIWDSTNILFTRLNDTHYRMYNRYIEKVEADPVRVELDNGEVVTLRGGYYPLQFDHLLSDIAAKQKEEDLLKNQSQAVYRSTKPEDGFNYSRRPGHSLPPRLDTGVWFNHIENVSRYISHAEYMRDLNRLTQHPKWRRTMRDKASRQAYTQVRDWVSYLANPRRRVENTFEKILDKQRKLATIAILGANFSVGVKQRLSLFSAANDIGWEWIANGYKHVDAKTSILGLERSEMFDKILDQSPYMRARQNNIDREIHDATSKLSPFVRRFNILGKDFKWQDVQDFMFEWIQMNDRATVSVVWMGAYNKFMHENNTLPQEERNAKAVEFADAIVRTTQPSTLSIDLNAFQRSEGIMRMFTSFMTWTFKAGNRFVLQNRAYREGAISTSQYARHILYEGVMPSLGSAIIGTFISTGELPDWTEYLYATVGTAIGWIPFIRDFAGALKYNKDLGTAPGFEGFNRILKAGKTTWQWLEGTKELDQVLWDVARATEVQLGIPALKTYKNMKNTIELIEEGSK